MENVPIAFCLRSRPQEVCFASTGFLGVIQGVGCNGHGFELAARATVAVSYSFAVLLPSHSSTTTPSKEQNKLANCLLLNNRTGPAVRLNICVTW